MTAGDEAAAKADYDRVIAQDPTLTQAGFARLGMALKEKDHAKTLELLLTLEDKARVELKDLKTVPEFADFVKSPEFERWEQRQSKGVKPPVSTP